MNISLDEILNLFSTQGYAQYGGESISQLEHGLQCATLAQDQGVSPELITAALLHDLGHLVHNLGENPHYTRWNDSDSFSSHWSSRYHYCLAISLEVARVYF